MWQWYWQFCETSVVKQMAESRGNAESPGEMAVKTICVSVLAACVCIVISVAAKVVTSEALLWLDNTLTALTV